MEGKKVYTQITWIPKGGCYRSILADIYLFIYEDGLQVNKDLQFYKYMDVILNVKINNIQNECVLS